MLCTFATKLSTLLVHIILRNAITSDLTFVTFSHLNRPYMAICTFICCIFLTVWLIKIIMLQLHNDLTLQEHTYRLLLQFAKKYSAIFELLSSYSYYNDGSLRLH